MHPDTQRRETWCTSRVSTVLRSKYREEFDAIMEELMEEGDHREKARGGARRLLRQRHPDESAALKRGFRKEWNEKQPDIARQIEQRMRDTTATLVDANKRSRGLKKQLGVKEPVMSGNETDQLIRDNYTWIQQKRRGR